MIFLRINLTNFMQFKQFEANRAVAGPCVILLKARFFRFCHCKYKQFKR